jgi:hypothetical protein
MNEEAVRALKEAMEPPAWWLNGARLKPREVLGRLEELGYTVARTSQAGAAGSSVTAGSPAQHPGQQVEGNRLADLMTDLETNVAAVRESRPAEQPIRREQRESA